MALRKLFAAALASLPLAALAQAAAPAEPAKPPETQAAPPATPAPAAEPAKPAAPAKPAEPTVKVTPYGFVLANAFWDDVAFAARDYPASVVVPNSTGWANVRGGSFVMSARQSRFGVRLALKDDNWTGAEFSGTVEFDFKAGHLPGNTTVGNPTCTADAATPPNITCTQGTVTTGNNTIPSQNWNAGVMRLRVASATATWKTALGNFSILGGQDYGLVNPLFAESVSWVADPIFWQAGNYWRRTPQFRATFAPQLGMIGLNVAVAMLSPSDATTPVDFGAGTRARSPDLEGRIAASVKVMPDVSGTVGVGYHTNKRRYNQNAATEKDVTATLVGIDADLNLTQFVQVKGEWYDGKGTDDTYNGLGTGVLVNTAVANDFIAVGNSGYWAQAILKPLPQVWVIAGYGQSSLDEGDLKKVVATASQATTRQKNAQIHGGVILNAGKFWRVGFEACKTETTYLAPLAANGTEKKFDGMAYALSSMFRF